MLPSPSSSPRAAFVNCTNFTATPFQRLFSLPTPPQHAKVKRSSSDAEVGGAKKRVKIDVNFQDDELKGVRSDVQVDDVTVDRRRGRYTVMAIMNARINGRSGGPRLPIMPMQAILQTFVSSHKADVYKCHSVSPESYLTVPYACTYSNDAKGGGTPLLGVATEQGSVHIINTSKRRDWDVEPPRITLQPHTNGIFDIKWSPTDTLIATSSGDQTTSISDPNSSRTLYTLRGHSSTVKCVAWDPTHTELLSTGGRDGMVCVWDLRMTARAGEGGGNGVGIISPVLRISGAHGEGKHSRARKKSKLLARSITSLLYPMSDRYGIISSGSFDGILNYWDLRTSLGNHTRSSKPRSPGLKFSSPHDPTTCHNSRRPRGITSLTLGTGPSAGLIFAIGTDSHIYTYHLPSLTAIPGKEMGHENMQTNSFYVRNSMSPCGKWLATGCAGINGSVFLFDVSNASRMGDHLEGGKKKAVELTGQRGEVGALDWAEGCLASCADDGTVRVWRPDLEVHSKCLEQPEEAQWDWSWATRD